MKLIISIDTEEDNWGEFKPTGHTLKNIQGIKNLQKIFDEYSVKPTYLLTYSVANNESCAEIFREIIENGKGEIGAHCHPWNTPPFQEYQSSKNSILCNLPVDLQYQKIKVLYNTIKKKLGIEPKSFRAGRWGFGDTVAKNLCKLGFATDTSISPYCDWSRDNGPNFIYASPFPHVIHTLQKNKSHTGYRLIEIPATVGFLQKNQKICRFVSQALKTPLLKPLRLTGILYHLRLLNLVWLSPELNEAKEMVELSSTLKKLGHSYLNMSFHSTSLLPGKSPFVKDQFDLDKFYAKIREFLKYTVEEGMQSLSLFEAANDFIKNAPIVEN